MHCGVSTVHRLRRLMWAECTPKALCVPGGKLYDQGSILHVVTHLVKLGLTLGWIGLD